VNAALKLDPQSADANALLAKIYFTQEKHALALVPLNRAIKAQPNEPTHRYLRARI
jgi:Tfp pilus assembly protein PilF